MASNKHQRQPTQADIQPVLAALNSGQFAAAEAAGKKLLKNFPKAFVAHQLYGSALASQNKAKEAIVAFKKALEIDPSVAELHFNLAILQSNANRIDEAITSYQRAVRLKPELVDAHYNLGIVLQSQNKYERAIESYQNAIDREPGFYEAITNQGVCYQELGKLEHALATYQQALNIHQDAQLFYNMGTALKNLGRLGDAIEAFNQAIAMAPDYADAYASLAEVLRDQGRYDESVDNFKKALELDPDLPIANYSLAVYYYDSGDLAQALNYFERSQAADWQERSLYCLYKTGRFEEFKAGLENLKQRKDNSPFLATLAGHYAENFGTENDYNFCKTPLDFVFHDAIPELKGDSALLKQLLEDIKRTDLEEKSQGRLYNGVQSAGNLFKRSEESFQTLARCVTEAIQRYRDTFAGQDCVFVKSFPAETQFASSWYVRMRQGGHLTSHIHEEGWVSGALYLSLPTQKQHEHEGSIELSTHGDDYPKQHDNFPIKTIAPEVGDIVMFPSSVFHRTIPFSSDEERICVAFDLKPA
jgi:uncharacterized protein (TIGR02466 family)